jgi:hypothetical protein
MAFAGVRYRRSRACGGDRRTLLRRRPLDDGAEQRGATNPEEALEALERAQRLNPLRPELFEREAALAVQIDDWD